MKEDFLHLLWQQQLHTRQNARLADGSPLTILKTGYRNSNSGPDFEQAKIVIDQLEWVGSVEIHVRASEWYDHDHQSDPAYQSVILHVVWEKDADVFRLDGTVVPTLELKDKIPLEVLLRYRELMNPAPKSIACESFLSNAPAIRMTAMQERVLTERLERKAREILKRWMLNGKDWQETFYQSLAHTLGLKINADPMLLLAQSVPVRIFASLGWNDEKVFSLLLGQAGFLEEENKGESHIALRTEYEYLRHKYQLGSHSLAWKQFRIRPGSFPVHRVLILASMVHKLPDWFRILTEKNTEASAFFSSGPLSLSPVLEGFLQEARPFKSKISWSSFLRDTLIVNFFSPFLAALGLAKENPDYIENALDWLYTIRCEPNAITRMWESFGIGCESAATSQALNELYSQYCIARRCMECSLGSCFLGKGA
ncbi:MAG TPA: DUF2851 family protein [Catalimonadaceae bacterium]|nr:DUF2851 family protein [Catalimonadaceae bacterium]